MGGWRRGFAQRAVMYVVIACMICNDRLIPGLNKTADISRHVEERSDQKSQEGSE